MVKIKIHIWLCNLSLLAQQLTHCLKNVTLTSDCCYTLPTVNMLVGQIFHWVICANRLINERLSVKINKKNFELYLYCLQIFTEVAASNSGWREHRTPVNNPVRKIQLWPCLGNLGLNNIQGVPKKKQFSGILAITPLWKGLELKVGSVSKTSGNSLCIRHKNFPIWPIRSWENWVQRWQLSLKNLEKIWENSFGLNWIFWDTL